MQVIAAPVCTCSSARLHSTCRYAALERAVAADAAAEGTVTVTVLTALEVAMVLPHFTFSA